MSLASQITALATRIGEEIKLVRAEARDLLNTMADHGYSGDTAQLVAAAGVVFGDVCYINSAGKMAKGDADALATSAVIAMAMATIATDATGTFFIGPGIVRDDTWAWTPGGLVYLSATAGTLTQTAPAGVDDVVQIVGVALTADKLFFNPQLVMVVHV